MADRDKFNQEYSLAYATQPSKDAAALVKGVGRWPMDAAVMAADIADMPVDALRAMLSKMGTRGVELSRQSIPGTLGAMARRGVGMLTGTQPPDRQQTEITESPSGWEETGRALNPANFMTLGKALPAVGGLGAVKNAADKELLMGLYRGYAGDNVPREKLFASPQRAVAERYANKRASQTGEDPRVEMLMVNPFAGRKYGHATVGTGAEPPIPTMARELSPDDVVSRFDSTVDDLYKRLTGG